MIARTADQREELDCCEKWCTRVTVCVLRSMLMLMLEGGKQPRNGALLFCFCGQ